MHGNVNIDHRGQPITGSWPRSGGGSCRWAFFNRNGGVSIPPFQSLNIGLHVGDAEDAVLENRRRVRTWLGVSSLLSARQVHGDRIFCLGEPITEDQEVDGYDALITNQPDIALVIQQADCQAVLLADPVNEVVAAIHCGWRGSVQEIIGKTISSMGDAFGSKPGDCMAVVSPSLGPCCGEFVNYQAELPEDFWKFQVREHYFDFWQISRRQLVDAGLQNQHIMVAEVCTSCDHNYFSYRRASRNRLETTGRFCSAICLQ